MVPRIAPRSSWWSILGRATATLFFSETGTHLAYYDIGAAVLGSTFTRPRTSQSFCVAAGTIFILSHWDEDHYASLYEIHAFHPNQLTNTRWLAPDQAPDPTKHLAHPLAPWRNSIEKSANSQALDTWLVAHVPTLNIWPDEPPGNVLIGVAHSPNFDVIKVGGNNTNNHALALRVKRQGANEYMLLTGDAEYQAGTFVHGCDQVCANLVASHHGATVNTPAENPSTARGTEPGRVLLRRGQSVLSSVSSGWNRCLRGA